MSEQILSQQQIALQDGVIKAVGVGYPGLAYALSFYPAIAENFISVQTTCRRGHGEQQGFWFTTGKDSSSKDIRVVIPEAVALVEFEREIDALRGHGATKEYLPDVRNLNELVATFDAVNTPLEEIRADYKVITDMKRRVLEKLGVTATEISIAQVYLAREEEASGFDKSVKKRSRSSVNNGIGSKRSAKCYRAN